jgi:predicted nucleotidyltransferase
VANNIIQSLLSVSDLQRAPGKALKRLRDTQGPLYITQRGRPVAVLSLPEPQQPTKPIAGTTTHASSPVSQRRDELIAALQKMLPAIIDKYAPEKIILFGSLATGTVRESSDIDLVIIKKTTKRFLDRQLDVIRIADPDVATDFFVYTPEELAEGIKTSPHVFQKEIIAKGKVLYEK